MKNPQVTIIIPTFNHGHFIAEAINSVLKQTYPHYQIIVIDDGSTDNTADIVAQFGDAVHYHWQENQGLSAARNTGLSLATGDLINFLDADDWHFPQFLENLLNHLTTHPHLDGVACGYRFATEFDQPLAQSSSHTVPSVQLHTKLLAGNFIAAQCFLLKRHLFISDTRFDTHLTACEDWDMWLRLSRYHHIAVIPDILTQVRVRLDSMSGNQMRMLVNRFAVIQKYYPNPQTEPAPRAYAFAYFRTAIEYLQSRQMPQALQCLRVALRFYPPLAQDPELYYELACSDQSRGNRGHLQNWDPTQAQEYLFSTLETLGLTSPQNQTYAYWTLGKLSHQTGAKQNTRHFCQQALITKPVTPISLPLLKLYARTFLPK
ncbi:MAG TPA: glycosyltransferase family A protein [Anaerolineae bacterium]|nr:glycosyltransferase family A protein [Anaerolineae bacterium]